MVNDGQEQRTQYVLFSSQYPQMLTIKMALLFNPFQALLLINNNFLGPFSYWAFLSPLHLAHIFSEGHWAPEFRAALPPAAKISALSLAQVQPRKHLQGRLLSDPFSTSDRLALCDLLGSPSPGCVWGGPGERTWGWGCHLGMEGSDDRILLSKWQRSAVLFFVVK